MMRESSTATRSRSSADASSIRIDNHSLSAVKLRNPLTELTVQIPAVLEPKPAKTSSAIAAGD
jgi:hypothetical protein